MRINIKDATIVTVCPFCGCEHNVDVTLADYDAWLDGKSILAAFPYLDADEREMLISGICPECW